MAAAVRRAWYIGFACKSCGAHFAIMNALTEPGSLEIGGPATFTVACSNCGAESAYSGGELTQFQAAQGGAGLGPP